MKGLIFLMLRYYKGLIKVLFSFLKKAWAPWTQYFHEVYYNTSYIVIAMIKLIQDLTMIESTSFNQRYGKIQSPH